MPKTTCMDIWIRIHNRIKFTVRLLLFIIVYFTAVVSKGFLKFWFRCWIKTSTEIICQKLQKPSVQPFPCLILGLQHQSQLVWMSQFAPVWVTVLLRTGRRITLVSHSINSPGRRHHKQSYLQDRIQSTIYRMPCFKSLKIKKPFSTNVSFWRSSGSAWSKITDQRTKRLYIKRHWQGKYL